MTNVTPTSVTQIRANVTKRFFLKDEWCKQTVQMIDIKKKYKVEKIFCFWGIFSSQIIPSLNTVGAFCIFLNYFFILRELLLLICFKSLHFLMLLTIFMFGVNYFRYWIIYFYEPIHIKNVQAVKGVCTVTVHSTIIYRKF